GSPPSAAPACDCINFSRFATPYCCPASPSASTTPSVYNNIAPPASSVTISETYSSFGSTPSTSCGSISSDLYIPSTSTSGDGCPALATCTLPVCVSTTI